MMNINPGNFCPSPWFHMHIQPSGKLKFCRWQHQSIGHLESDLTQENFLKYFQEEMSTIRMDMLQGNSIPACTECVTMEKHNKISGRESQLLKVGIQRDNFQKTFRSSTFYNEFVNSSEKLGHTDLWPQDWQIDLGNQCNSNCIFCSPQYSSKLAAEFKKIGIANQMPLRNWTDDSNAVDHFVEMLAQSKKLAYLHFLGGETVIIPAFKKILTELISRNLHRSLSIGFTTNLTVWDQSVVDLLTQFKEVNLGLSIECLHPINDYLRWPSKINQVERTIEKWLNVAKDPQWLIHLRTTPTMFSIKHLTTIYEYAYKNSIGVESCNFLERPKCLRMNVLPMHLRVKFADDIQQWVNSKSITKSNEKIINFRDPNLLKQYIINDAESYVKYLLDAPDETHRLADTISYIKKLEKSRGNTILDYVTSEYKEILQSAGY